MSGEAFSSIYIIHVNTMNKVFNLLIIKNINTKFNNKYSKYYIFLAMQ